MPEEAVRKFVDTMQTVHGEQAAARAAYELLWSKAKDNLRERAKRASAVAGRTVAPQEMLAPSRFSLRFVPEQFSSRIQGNWAVVTVKGSTEADERRVQSVHEDGAWRVVVQLPPVPPINSREDETLLE